MKVLVNGCSHLAGTELNKNDEVAKTLSWPNYIKSWNTITNLAMPASSNDSICRRTIQELEKNNYDFVLIQWTHFDRIELQIPFYNEHGVHNKWFCINSNNAYNKIELNGNPDFINELARSIFLKQFDEIWFNNFNIAQIVMLQTYLKTRNIPYKFGWVLNKELKISTELEIVDTNNIIDTTWIDYCNRNNFKRLINHYNQDAHVAYSQQIKLGEIA